ncbi:TPA: hypothetical protein DCZ46_03190 [Candidatus Campbellbacteria bacterium]|nr:MAG: seg [Candidatus Campbellbacteria bacterium GW2011_OD1_34_28]KKP74865.1 MAG: hypothetical protein UR74_C0002G0131 [Candidatus Campbellbacteria bacterium GW2011_GWD2_35_24]KKP75751.1 MAG: hypothetical protein UR75_C0002G0132 [Candidatus Campbellbacteria bacterium GW2011_GWC2_35_28]KKP77001.1 MAG: hypothetical protein UR76_C0002G0202 [Candidatus Campbellbacteria bacterium GW2011_GWC1_35_31]KKP78927.1 MAG: hypothetical protein UR79_C0002G0202 [Candidatus Campbellbacteria bacterium GW2011_GW
MSRKRDIDLNGGKLLKKGPYIASAKIFEDTDNLALCINIINEETRKVTISKWFNIETLNLDDKKEDWLALMIALSMLSSAKAGREEKAEEVRNSWKELMSVLEIC